jgi:hypothetical protein
VRVIVDGINHPDAVTSGIYTFEDVLDNHTISAQFEKKNYNVFWQDVSGAILIPVDGSTSPVEHGGKFKFVVELMNGYTQSNPTVRVNNIITNPVGGVYSINNIIKDQEISISSVEPNQYKVVAGAYTGGTISPAGVFMVTHGDSKTFEITPNEGYIIQDVMVNGVSVGVKEYHIFDNIQADATINAYFKLNIVGIEENEEAAIHVFSHNNVVTIINNDLIPVKQVEIMDMFGRIVWAGQASDTKTEITLSVAKGIYGVRILTGDAKQLTAKVVIH